MESLVWLGVDIGKDSFHAAVTVQRLFGLGWRKLPCASFKHSKEGMGALLSWLETNSVTPGSLDGVCVESTGRLAQQFVNLAQGRLGGVSIINPARSKSFMKSLGFKHKNDSVDARLLAYFGQQMRPRAQAPKDGCYEELRELNRAYEDLKAHGHTNARSSQSCGTFVCCCLFSTGYVKTARVGQNCFLSSSCA